jgi:hypothetical protein
MQMYPKYSRILRFLNISVVGIALGLGESNIDVSAALGRLARQIALKCNFRLQPMAAHLAARYHADHERRVKMAIRVFIKRICEDPSNEKELFSLVRKLRSLVPQQPGYLSSEYVKKSDIQNIFGSDISDLEKPAKTRFEII